MDDGRRNMLISAAFGGVVVVAIIILLGAIAIGWYSDNFGEVATVNGQTIDRSEFRDRYRVESFRLDLALRRLRDDLQAGRISESDHDVQADILNERRQDANLQQAVLARLIDQELEGQLAPAEGVSVSDADVDARMAEDATRPEMREAHVIAVDPEVSAASGTPTDAEKAAARETLEKALADIAGGKPWAEVAALVSTDPSSVQGGELGYVSARDESLDPAFHDALFAASANEPTAIVEGADGIFRAGLVTAIAPALTEPDFEQQLLESQITVDAYRAAVRGDVLRERLEEKIVAGVIEGDAPQRRTAEIYLDEGLDKVRVRHILFSPKDDPDGAADLALDDPAWAAAEAEAEALHTTLAANANDDAALLAAFEEAAKNSDEEGAGDTGGLLPYLSEEQLDPDFATAVFADGLESGDLLEPVKSVFGWHVVLFDDRQPPAQIRMEAIRQRALAPAASFATIAQEVSEGLEAEDGGDLGWVARGQLSPKAREDAIFAAPIGGISNVLAVPGEGYYLFKVSEEADRPLDLDQVEALRNSAYANWYGEKQSAADIKSGSTSLTPEG
jgi:parvulin-like peptidyl-prolyl isomerase